MGKYCALAVCVMFNKNVNEHILTENISEKTRTVIENTREACKLDRETSRLMLKDAMDCLSHSQTLLKIKDRIQTCPRFYSTMHDKLFDFLVKYFGQKIIDCLIKNPDNCLIRDRFLLERSHNMKSLSLLSPQSITNCTYRE